MKLSHQVTSEKNSNRKSTSTLNSIITPSSIPEHAQLPKHSPRSFTVYLKRQFNRISSTCQSISHLSSSFSDSIHSNSFIRIPSLPSSHIQVAQDELSPHRKRILGSVPDRWPMYSNDPNDYLLTHQIGFGTSSVVRLAQFKPRPGELCAIKVIDIDQLSPKQIEYLRAETTLMSLAKHPNVLRVRGEWIQGSSLCISMRLMKAGSIFDLIRYRYQDGFSEQVIATVLIQAIAGLNYLHSNGWIHRDLKAANLLLDNDGTVLLADFGVCLDRNLQSSNHHEEPDRSLQPSPIPQIPSTDPRPSPKRLPSFVGTALFMAPEVVTRQLYDDRADIWSFGITALEMAIGKPPHAANTPARVLMKTVQEPPPTLDRNPMGSPHRYSKKFQEFISRCLKKDPSERPSAKELLCKEKFFRQARHKSYLLQTILKNALPPLERRQERLVSLNPSSLSSNSENQSDPVVSPVSSTPQSRIISNQLPLQKTPNNPSLSLCCPWDFNPDSPSSTKSFHLPGTAEHT